MSKRILGLSLVGLMTLGLMLFVTHASSAAHYKYFCNCCGQAVLRVGQCDNFSGSTEATHPSDRLVKWIAGHYKYYETKPCDDDQIDRYWAHTFTDLRPKKGCKITGAFLCITICNEHYNDHLKIGVIEDPSVDWSSPPYFNTRLTKVGIPVNTCSTITLDLSHLEHPHAGIVNLLPAINDYGWLDVAVDDDSPVDSAVLILISGAL